MSASAACYHLPGLFEFYDFYRVFLPLFRQHREYFYDWCRIASLYGAPADCIWGGGRVGSGDRDPREVLALTREYGISARLTFSNSLLRPEHLSDPRCNRLCRLLAESPGPQNGVIVHSDLLLDHLRRTYPGLYFVSSTTKVLTDFSLLRRELERPEFRYVVADFRLNRAFRQLGTLPQALRDKAELLCNECCAFGCRDRAACYRSVSRENLGMEGPVHRCTAPDAAGGYRFSRAMENPGFIGVNDIRDVYLPMGFSQFKIEGRSLGTALLLEFLLHYLTRPLRPARGAGLLSKFPLPFPKISVTIMACMPNIGKEVRITTITSASLPAKKRILTVCVKLFLEQGYKKTTVAEIVHKAAVSNSIFQNIFRAKDGVLTELAEFMFSNQFSMARDVTGKQLPPAYVYAAETAIQMTLTELNENLREIYVESYTHSEVSEFIFRATARELYRIFGPYQPELTEEDFYTLELGSAGLMRGYMVRPCDGTLTLEKKLRMFLTLSLRGYKVPEEEVQQILRFVEGLDIRTVAEQVMQKLFQALAMHYEFSLSEEAQAAAPAAPSVPTPPSEPATKAP